MKKFSLTYGFAAASLIALAVAFVLFAKAANAQPAPQTFYVSRSGNNADGLSWATAWNELNQINWSQVPAGSLILLDGGTTGMVYQTTLQVMKTCTIERALGRGHSGQVVLDGTNSAQNIGVVSSYSFTLTGKRWRGIVIRNWRSGGVSMLQGGPASRLSFLEVHGNGFGVTSGGQGLAFGVNSVNLDHLIVHDNRSNGCSITGTSPGGSGQGTVDRCWFYNSAYPTIYSQGISCSGSLTARESVFGPGLRQGVVTFGPLYGGGYANLSNDLFINAYDGNIVPMAGAPFGGGGNISRITSFMTKLNPAGMTHHAFDSPAGPMNVHVNQSVVWAGNINLAAGSYGTQNTQYKTTGNTTALSSEMVDPRFLWGRRIADYPDNVPIQTLIETNFALAPDSPALGTGSSVTSVKQLLSMP